jgi:polyribonucleotide nucleotidyltransferase
MGGQDDSGRQPPIPLNPTADSLIGPQSGGPQRLNCKTLQIPVDAKPFLIGKGGKVINEIRGKTQSYIQINNAGPGDKFCTVMITGNVEKVEELINEQLSGWGVSPNKPQPDEKILETVRKLAPSAGIVKPLPSNVAPPVQMSTASIWNWNRM